MTVLDGVALKRHPNGASTLFSIVFVVYIMYEAVIMRIAQCYAAIFLWIMCAMEDFRDMTILRYGHRHSEGQTSSGIACEC